MTDEQKARLATKRPLTKEEYEARQSVIRRVVDPETGRTRWGWAPRACTCNPSRQTLKEGVRPLTCLVSLLLPGLVRGEGEIIEEMVSREKHKDINKVKEKKHSAVALWHEHNNMTL